MQSINVEIKDMSVGKEIQYFWKQNNFQTKDKSSVSHSSPWKESHRGWLGCMQWRSYLYRREGRFQLSCSPLCPAETPALPAGTNSAASGHASQGFPARAPYQPMLMSWNQKHALHLGRLSQACPASTSCRQWRSVGKRGCGTKCLLGLGLGLSQLQPSSRPRDSLFKVRLLSTSLRRAGSFSTCCSASVKRNGG